MTFDYKKEYKEFYMPKSKPSIVTIPSMNYIAIRGKGDPNAEDGEYKATIGLLYGIAFTIKMSKKGDHQIDGYFDYVVPPLEGFWWQDGVEGIDYAHKENFRFISVIRLPDFVTKADFDWAIAEATKKKKADFSKVEFLTIDEGLEGDWNVSEVAAIVGYGKASNFAAAFKKRYGVAPKNYRESRFDSAKNKV